MTPSRRQTYHRGRNRREVVVAVLTVLAILAVTCVLLWLFAPSDAPVP